MSRVHVTYERTPSVSPPPSASHWRHITICPPITPEGAPAPTSHAPAHQQQPTFLISPPTSHPSRSGVLMSSRGMVARGSSSASSRSSSQASTNRSLSPPSSRGTSPSSSSSCSSRASSASRKSVHFADGNLEYPPPVERSAKGWEYVSSRGMGYHRDYHHPHHMHEEFVFRGRERERDSETLVVEKARRGGRGAGERHQQHGRKRSEEVEGGVYYYN